MGNIVYQQMMEVLGILYKPVGSQVRHHIHFPFEKSIIERTIQYIKDRIESFDYDYFPYRIKNCNLKHIRNWLNLFVDYHNNEIKMK